MQSHKAIALLAAILPIFLRLAAFYVGGDEIAARARSRLGSGNSFFAQLNVELRLLDKCLSNITGGAKISIEAFNAVLNVLSSFDDCLKPGHSQTDKGKKIRVQGNSKVQQDEHFRSLERLQALIANENPPIRKILEFFDMEKVGSYRSRRSKLLDAVSCCQKRLLKCNRALKTTKTSTNQQSSLPKSTNAPHDDARRLTSLAFSKITELFNCTCNPSALKARLLLDRHTAIEDIECRLNLMFEGASPSEPTSGGWQHCNIQFMDKRSEGGPSVHFEDYQPEPSLCESLQDVSTICGLVHSAPITLLQLKLLTDQQMLKYVSSDSLDMVEPSAMVFCPFVQLSAVITGVGTPFNISEVTPQERIALAIIIANSFLHLYESGWWPEKWDASYIYLSIDQESGTPDCRGPYLATSCSYRNERILFHQRSARLHPYPHIFKLGTLLMELLEGRAIASAQDIDDFLDAQGQPHFAYREAVNACIEVQTFPRGVSFEDTEFRKNFWDLIISRLEEEFQNSFKARLESLREKVSADAILKKSTLQRLIEQRETKVAAPENVPVSPMLVLEMDQSSEASPPENAFTTHGMKDVVFHTDTLNFELMSEGQFDSAKDWIEKLQRRVHPFIGSKVAVDQIQSAVKIALLDTGVDFPSVLSNIGIKVAECRTWLGAGIPPEGIHMENQSDHDGHGTHGAGLLLKIAPNTIVYAAQVFHGRSESQAPAKAKEVHQRIALAIKYAVQTWKVDIISMSFGFPATVQIIDDALTEAYKEKVLMFASASNVGGNAGLTYPAHSPLVMEIYATDGVGNKYNRNLTPRPKSRNFATLGVAVPSWWPQRFDKGPEMRSTGTSVATSIAAGIAALVLEIVRKYSKSVNLPEADQISLRNELLSAEGMAKVFDKMAALRDGYDYIEPWKLVDVTRPELSNPTATVLEIFKAIKS